MGKAAPKAGVAKVATPATKKIITQEDLDANPQLVADGVKVGDESPLPAPKAAAKPKAVAAADTIEVGGKVVKVKFGGNIPDMGVFTKEELLANPEAVAFLLEIGSGCVQIVEPSKEV
jgi:hypothetical protein